MLMWRRRQNSAWFSLLFSHAPGNRCQCLARSDILHHRDHAGPRRHLFKMSFIERSRSCGHGMDHDSTALPAGQATWSKTYYDEVARRSPFTFSEDTV